jgi:lysophospholipase L1-like esterase
MSPTVFERNPVKTLISVMLIIILSLDVTTERLFDRNDLFNRLLSTLNENLAFKVGIWQHRKQNPYYHHDLEPNHSFIERWGVLEYKLVTNSLGFKDSKKRAIQPDTPKKRILFIGDSFTEGLGMPYEKTFVGLVDKNVDHEKVDILNAAVVSYSPKIYYYKTKYLLENKHLKINELFVFIDISDIYNELEYEIFEPQENQRISLSPVIQYASDFLRHNSFLYNVAKYYYGQYQNRHKLDSLNFVTEHREEANFWTLNENVYRKWGEKGVQLAEKHIQLLTDLCKAHNIKMTIAVYPWQNELYFGNRNSRQVQIWRDFSDRNGINFISYYPDFFNAPIPGTPYSKVTPHQIVENYFIPGDIHWNENGHRLIAEKIHINN